MLSVALDPLCGSWYIILHDGMAPKKLSIYEKESYLYQIYLEDWFEKNLYEINIKQKYVTCLLTGLGFPTSYLEKITMSVTLFLVGIYRVCGCQVMQG